MKFFCFSLQVRQPKASLCLRRAPDGWGDPKREIALWTPNPPLIRRRDLTRYGLGELDDASAQIVREHLEQCSDCRRQVAEMLPDSFLGRLRDARKDLGCRATDRPSPVAGRPNRQWLTVSRSTSSSPCMSATGQVDATSDALNSPADTSLPAGTRIGYFGDYELLKVLGEGGMGIVYKARQLSLNRPVALKMIKTARFASAGRGPPVSERVRGGRPARSPQHCAGVRGRPVRRPALLQHEADRR